MTKREQYANALKTLGMVEIPSRSRKYMTFQSPNGNGPIYYLGSAGAIRQGQTVADSIPIDGSKILILAARVK